MGNPIIELLVPFLRLGGDINGIPQGSNMFPFSIELPSLRLGGEVYYGFLAASAELSSSSSGGFSSRPCSAIVADDVANIAKLCGVKLSEHRCTAQ